MSAGAAISGGAALLALLGVGMAVLAIVLFARGQRRYAAARARWRPTTAVIVTASTSTVKGRAVKGSSGINSVTTTYNFPHVTYTYTAGGRQRSGDRPFLLTQPAFDAQEARDWLATVPVGATVPAFFNPDDADESALVLNQPRRFLLIYGIACGIALIGGAVFFYTSLQP